MRSIAMRLLRRPPLPRALGAAGLARRAGGESSFSTGAGSSGGQDPFQSFAGFGNLFKKTMEEMEKTRERLEQLRVEGSAGAGLVTVTLRGDGAMESCSIDEAMAGKVAVIADLVRAAHEDARSKLDKERQEAFGGLPLPDLPFPGR